MRKNIIKTFLRQYTIILIGVAIGVSFWFFEAFMHFIFFEERSFLNILFYPDNHEFWMRSFVVTLFVLFGIYAQYIINVLEIIRKNLKHQNDFFNKTIESLTHPFYVIEADSYKIRIANSAACQCELSEGKTCYELTHKRHDPCTGIEHSCPLEEVKKTKRPVAVEHIHYDLKGSLRNVEVHAYPIFDENGNVVEMIEYSLDITERKKTEKALKNARNNLEIRVKERTVELARANEIFKETARNLEQTNRRLQDSQVQLVQSEKMASLGQLAAGIAHEINNPMGFVLSNLNTLNEYVKVFKLLLSQYETLTDAVKQGKGDKTLISKITDMRQQNSLDYILGDIDNLFKETMTGADRVKEIVEGLRSFAYTDETKMVETDVNKCIEDTLKIVWSEIKYKCELDKRFGKIPLVYSHPGQLNQIFMNLLVNAGQAIQEEGKITVETMADDTHVIVKISDTGKGISSENISKVFDPFYTTKEVGHGIGLGLSISHSIVRKHGGTITAESKLGKGSIFTVSLPIKK